MTEIASDQRLSPERVAGLRSGVRSEVRSAISGLPRVELGAWLRTADGGEVLTEAFRRMPEFYVAGLVTNEVIVRWRVSRPPAEQIDRDLVLGPELCTVRPADARLRPIVTLTFDSAGFVEMACAARRGVDLLLHGQLHIQGDVQTAMRMEALFGLGAGRGR